MIRMAAAPYEAGEEFGPAGSRIASLEPAPGGGNGRVFIVSLEDGSRFAVKYYSGPTADGRDRLDVEYSALDFLWRNGSRRAPRPIAMDRERNLGVYEYVEGYPALDRAEEPGGLGEVLSFVEELKSLRGADGAGGLYPAAEACFSVKDLLDNVRRRFEKLGAVDGEGDEYTALKRFLSEKAEPAVRMVGAWSESVMSAAGMRSDSLLPMKARTLSPSDFGFHNAIIRPGGGMVFIDFEYFGWDDPVKMICDFLLHPAMSLGDDMKREFYDGVLSLFGEDKGLQTRFSAMFPLFGLKWAAIMLNEFVPGHHRAGAGREARARQLMKSGALVDDITKNLGRSPFNESQCI